MYASRDPNEPKYSHNEFGVLREKTANQGVSWVPYNPNTQMYLSLGQYERVHYNQGSRIILC